MHSITDFPVLLATHRLLLGEGNQYLVNGVLTFIDKVGHLEQRQLWTLTWHHATHHRRIVPKMFCHFFKIYFCQALRPFTATLLLLNMLLYSFPLRHRLRHRPLGQCLVPPM